ncbi:Piso0_000689 [Millerozyma farinosa CBS 7064]|uniref:Piso0_000689 protein n=1 Tax=Pichia sorbitophila (strain ATCC MYA-4447 / BCRC 22081 / CBS 7064 / NBRC 10061 / NRRL Y-12695) TaxID=559304 RepID=G8YR89_PICSO|nr:Piso0_000689 [Millerozyma farinosa CBS 7064]
MTGTPVLQYKIPYDEWYIVLTSEGIHFYFNEADRHSYWQLHDVFEAYPSIRKDEFARSINYDDVALLMAKVNGLDISHYIKHDRKEDEETEKKDELAYPGDDYDFKVHNGGKGERDTEQPSLGDYEDEENMNEYDKEEQEKFLQSFLEEEGLVKDPEETKPSNEPQNSKKVTLSIGYGSSSDEDESEIDENKELSSQQIDVRSIEEETPIESNDNREVGSETSASNADAESDLGFDLEGLESEELDVTSKESDFFRLLDEFSDKFSVFDEWSLIEEELLSELVKHPSFYSVPNAEERKLLFERWCKIQSQKRKPESDQEERIENKYSPEVESIQKSEEIEPVSSPKSEKLYPTIIQLYYRYLLENKSMVRKMLYPEFISVKKVEIEALFSDLTSKETENCFRQYRIMITDFAQHEKSMKKQAKTDTNMKKLKLDNFLMSSKLEASIQTSDVKIAEIEKLVADDKDYFDKWTELCNLFSIPPSIAENVQNFIVADEKRFHSYLEYIRSS